MSRADRIAYSVHDDLPRDAALYAALGYEVRYEHAVYPHGIVKYTMVHRT